MGPTCRDGNGDDQTQVDEHLVGQRWTKVSQQIGHWIPKKFIQIFAGIQRIKFEILAPNLRTGLQRWRGASKARDSKWSPPGLWNATSTGSATVAPRSTGQSARRRTTPDSKTRPRTVAWTPPARSTCSFNLRKKFYKILSSTPQFTL